MWEKVEAVHPVPTVSMDSALCFEIVNLEKDPLPDTRASSALLLLPA